MNFKHNKKYGQNFINDDDLILKIIKNTNIGEKDLVIEIGPGMGILSKQIIPLSKYTILYEIDERLEPILLKKLKKFSNYKLKIIDFLEADLKKDISEIEYAKLLVVANLPYYITTPILIKLIDEIYPDEITIMVQKEVADRIVALPKSKEYGYITVFLNSYYTAIRLFDVPRNKFTPSPNVDSSVIKLVKTHHEIIQRDKFNQFLKDSFKFKRKNLRNNLKNYNLTKIEDILKKHNYSLNNRAEEIPLKIFEDIYREL